MQLKQFLALTAWLTSIFAASWLCAYGGVSQEWHRLFGLVPLMLFEHTGDNRSGKTFLMALWGFFDWLRGQRVYANCRKDIQYPGGYDCFLNYPHWHYTPTQLYYMPEIYKCTVITDESLQELDARLAAKVEIREIGYFGRQATKAGVDWHWDAFEHTDIEKRIRKSWHYQIQTTRLPRDPNLPLIAIRVEWRSRYEARFHKTYFPNLDMNVPINAFFPVYNDKATIRRRLVEDIA